ncbi:MAG: hypothetical protein DRI24_20750, partial [Deltaproteobacteria bacterium]
ARGRRWKSILEQIELLIVHATAFSSTIQPLEEYHPHFTSITADALAVAAHPIVGVSGGVKMYQNRRFKNVDKKEVSSSEKG